MSYSRKKWLCLILVTFILKFGLAFYCSQLLFRQYPAIQYGVIAVDSGDTFSYLGAIDNLIETGEYVFWITEDKKVYAGRMPYYGAIYFVLRQFLPKSAAYDGYVLVQILADSLATVVFAYLCFQIYRRKSAFWLGFLVHFCSLRFILFSLQLWTESLSLSLFVFFAFFSHRFWAESNWKDAVWASLFLTLMTSLKPYLFLIYPIFFLSVWLVLRKNNKEQFGWKDFVSNSYRTVLLGLPLLILLTPWIVRNFIVLDRFIPTQQDFYAGYNYGKAHLAFVDFISAWGGSSVPWDAQDAGCYFLIDKAGKTCEYTLPAYALTDGYNYAEIERVRQNFLQLQTNYSVEFDEVVAAEFENLTRIYRQEQPFMNQVGARFLYFQKLFFPPYRYNFPVLKSSNYYWIFQNLFKAIQTGIHFLVLMLGAFCLINLGLNRKISLTFILIPLLIAIFFIELRTTERRYVEPVYLFLLIGSVAVIMFLGEWLKRFYDNYFLAKLDEQPS